MAEEAQLLADAAKLPIDERCSHANWKVRSAAYEQIKASCNSVFDSSDPVLSEYVGVFPKACADGNAAALDKALEALQAFLEKATDSAAGRIAGSASANIVAKALGARPSTMAKGIDCLMGFVELEQAEKITGSLLEGYKHKVPKVVLGSLEATLQLIRAFGGRVMPAQLILKSIGPMFESKDAKAREIAKNIVVELGRWMGPELIRANLYDKLRDAQKDDVEKLLQEAPAGRPKPERLTRKEAEKAAAAAVVATGPAAEGGAVAVEGAAVAAAADEEPEQIDSYEFAEAKDIIPELKKDFWDGLVAAKWSERKAALTMLKELAAYPRLANGDYADVNRELKKIITKDSNINVVAEAINCTANIAKGLRKDYRGPAMSLCPVLLEKFKDKAAVVTRAAAEALDCMSLYSFTLPDVAEDVTAALTHQNPKVKESTAVWLANCTKRETKANVLKLLSEVVPAAAKCTDEGAPAIREAALGFLVQAALKAGSLASLDKGLSKMDDGKRKKLEEMVQEAAKARRPGAAAAAAGGAPAAAPAPVRASSNRFMRPPASGGSSPVTSPRPSSSGPAGRQAATSRSTSVRSSSSRPPTGAKARPAAAAAGGAAASASAGSGAVEDEAALSGGLLSAHDAKDRLTELFGEALTAALGDTVWKTRLEAMDTVVAKTQEPDAASYASVLTQCMAHLPGFEDKNFQVMAKEFEVIRCCAAHSTFTKRDALVAVMGATDKLADLKLKEPAFQMLLAASEAVGPQLVASLLHKRAAGHRNPKVLTETINWINLAVQEFLLPAFDVKTLIDWVKEDLGSANAATRTAATQFLGTLHAFVGPQLADMVRADLKPATMATVEAEFAKNPQQSGWEAKRICRNVGAPKAAAGGSRKGKGASAASAAEEPPSMDDLLPRADISGQITGELVSMLGSANWKERKAALDEVEGILSSAGGRIQPCVGDLMPALKGRMADSNKNLIAQALSLLAKLAKAMGRAIAREARPVLGPALRCICDSKANVRGAVIEMLEAWVSVAPPDVLFEELVEILPSPKCVSEGMQAAISWMASVYSAGKGTSSDCVAHAVKAVAVGAGYKTVPVREAAGQLLEAMLATIGLGEVQQAMHSLDKASQKTVAEALAKAGIAAGASAIAAPVSRPGTAASSKASTAASRPGTAASRAAAPASRPGTASVSRSVTASSVSSLRNSTAAGLAAVAAAEEGPLLSMDRNKDDRARKARFKSSKFEIRPEELQTLEAELGALAEPSLKANLFAKDFKKQVQAADAIRNWLVDKQAEVLEICISCLDLLLRWSVVRLAEGNTQTLVGVTGMLKVLFDLLAEQGYRFTEAEAKVFLPGLVEKCGQPTPQMKEACRDLIRRVATMYPPAKVVTFLQEGLLSKNNRSRVTSAEEIAYLFDREGPKVYAGAKCDVLQALAKLTSEQGKEIRAAALGALAVVYAYEGEGIWKRLGQLNSQQQGIIEERLKTVDKDLAKKGLSAGYKKAEYEAARNSQSLESSYSEAPSMLATAAGIGGRSILDSVQVGSGATVTGAYGGYGAGEAPVAASAAACGGSAVPGLNSSAGLISLRSSAAGAANDANSMNGQPGLLATADYSASGQSHMLLMTAPSGPAAHEQPMTAGRQAGAPQVPPQSAAAQGAGLNLQPLQSFTNLQDLQDEFDKCVRVLQSGHIDDVVEVMKLLCYEMMDLQRTQAAAAAGNPSSNPQAEVVRELLRRQVDPLVVLLIMQTHQVFVTASNAMRMGQLSNAHCRACKYALNTLMNIFSSNSLPAGLRPETLASLVRVLLLRLVDDNLGRMAEGEALLKALNVLMLKILENSNRNYTFSALLSLLLDVPAELAAGVDAAQQQTLSMRWADLVVKCLIKSTKALPQVINTIDLRSLLLSIHGFFEALGVDEIRRRSHADDKPLRMVKTILHELCKLKGTDIYRYTADIPQQGSTSGADGKPVIFPYIDLNIQTLQGNGGLRTAGVQVPVTPGRPAAAVAGSAVQRTAALTPGAALRAQKENIVAKLSEVFTRLSTHMQASSKDSTEKRAVLMDIYNISQEQGMPIEKLMAMYLPDTTPAFKSWISGEMRRIDEEMQHSGQQQQIPAAEQHQRDIPVLDVSHVASAANHASVHRAPDAPAAGSPATAGKLSAPAAIAVSNSMEALKARMNQLQAEKARVRPATAAEVPGPAAEATSGVFLRSSQAATSMTAGSEAAPVQAPVQTAAAPQPAASGVRNLQDLRSRMRGLLP